MARHRPLPGLRTVLVSRHYPELDVRHLERPDELIPLTEAAWEAGLDSSSLRHEIRNGRLHTVKRGRDWWVVRHELWNYLERKDPRGRPATRARAEGE